MIFSLLSLCVIVRSGASTDLMDTNARPAESAWSKYVGQQADFVVQRIREENPELRLVLAVPTNYMVTLDFRTDRVRVYHDANGRVTRPPKVG